MKTLIKSMVFVLGLTLYTGVLATDRPSHFKGLEAPNLQVALENFNEYNQRLEKILANDLTDADLATIHQLTYTLENALEKITQEISELAENLEEVHVASETFEKEDLKKAGEAYFEILKSLSF